jgi:hypothetical protein
MKQAIARFEAMWSRYIGDDVEVQRKALALCKGERRRKFQDGVTGESPAPAVNRDGRGPGVKYAT